MDADGTSTLSLPLCRIFGAGWAHRHCLRRRIFAPFWPRPYQHGEVTAERDPDHRGRAPSAQVSHARRYGRHNIRRRGTARPGAFRCSACRKVLPRMCAARKPRSQRPKRGVFIFAICTGARHSSKPHCRLELLLSIATTSSRTAATSSSRSRRRVSTQRHRPRPSLQRSGRSSQRRGSSH